MYDAVDMSAYPDRLSKEADVSNCSLGRKVEILLLVTVLLPPPPPSIDEGEPRKEDEEEVGSL